MLRGPADLARRDVRLHDGKQRDLAEAVLAPTNRRMASMPMPVLALTMATGELSAWASERGSR